jgi:hypothetical protein
MKKIGLNGLKKYKRWSQIFLMMITGMMYTHQVMAQDFIDQNPSNEINEPSQPIQKRSDVAFILVYMSTCPHCQRFDPIVKDYVTSHHIPILAYTLNGITLPSFQDSVTPTQAEIQKLFPNGSPVVPALFVVDLKNHAIIPALTGEASAAQLHDRMIQIEGIMLQNARDQTQNAQANSYNQNNENNENNDNLIQTEN